MKKVVCLLFLYFLIMPVTVGFGKMYPKNAVFTEKKPLVLFDFDDRAPVNNIGGMWGVFDFNPSDRDSFCRTSYKKDKDLHKKGYYLKVTYDVDSPQASFNGLWTKLNGIDLSKFRAISMKIKGDKNRGFTDFFKIELKDKENKIEAYIEDITDQWQTFVIPFDEFEGPVEDINWKNMNELVFAVFEDWRFKVKVGRLYFDDIAFIPKKGVKVKFSDIIGGKKKSKGKSKKKTRNK